MCKYSKTLAQEDFTAFRVAQSIKLFGHDSWCKERRFQFVIRDALI